MPHGNGDASGLGRRPNPRHRTSWEAPGQQRPATEQDPRTGAPRPRPGVPATTGRTPIARVRTVPPGPTGTAPIPLVGGAAPRPANGDPRLRTAPPAGTPMLVRAPEPVPPKPTAFAPPPAAPRPRRRKAGIAAVLAVIGLGLVNALPAFAGEDFSAPPVVAASDLQQMAVGDVDSTHVSTDPMTGQLTVQAAPAWVVPVTGRLGDAYGARPNRPVAGVSSFHRGQDLVAPCGSTVRAAAAGIVRTASYWGTYGNWILIDHGAGIATGYAHETRILVAPGQHVRAGQTIGLVGRTGAATGCHLHLEVHVGGTAVDPVPFFGAKHLTLGR